MLNIKSGDHWCTRFELLSPLILKCDLKVIIFVFIRLCKIWFHELIRLKELGWVLLEKQGTDVEDHTFDGIAGPWLPMPNDCYLIPLLNETKSRLLSHFCVQLNKKGDGHVLRAGRRLQGTVHLTRPITFQRPARAVTLLECHHMFQKGSKVGHAPSIATTNSEESVDWELTTDSMRTVDSNNV